MNHAHWFVNTTVMHNDATGDEITVVSRMFTNHVVCLEYRPAGAEHARCMTDHERDSWFALMKEANK